MIQIIYTGTTDIELVTDEEKTELMAQVMEQLKDKMSKSNFIFSSFSYQKSKRVKKGTVIFNCVIDVVPPQTPIQAIVKELNSN